MNSISYSNTSYAIVLGPASSAQGCISGYSQYGFSLGETASAMDCTTRSNANHGFVLSTGSRVLNCLAQGNGSPGFSCESSNAVVDGCQSINNQFGFLGGAGGNLIIRNYARSNFINFSIGSANVSGPIISFALGTSAGVITNSNPWANFAY